MLMAASFSNRISSVQHNNNTSTGMTFKIKVINTRKRQKPTLQQFEIFSELTIALIFQATVYFSLAKWPTSNAQRKDEQNPVFNFYSAFLL
jgi:hypothetical protein